MAGAPDEAFLRAPPLIWQVRALVETIEWADVSAADDYDEALRSEALLL